VSRVRVVQPGFGPTLRELLAPLPRPVRWATWAALVAAGAAAAWFGLAPGRGDEEVVVRGERTFNLAYGDGVARVRVPGTLLALERRRGPLLLDRMTVRSLTLPPYSGAASGVLPIVGGRHLEGLRSRLERFQSASSPEGRTRINDAPGYQVTFRYRAGRRTIYGRDILLVPVDGAREGVVLELRSTPAAGTPNAEATGTTGALRLPLRSFRFGTERSGG
jgi:hypothetical protein